MSKNTASDKFRRVNVDELDEDNYQDEDLGGGEAGLDVAARAKEVRTALNGGDKDKALASALAGAPMASKETPDKKTHFATVVSVITAFKASEIEAAVAKLDSDQLDVLMKYIYRGMEEPHEDYSANLLTWHKHVVTKGGHGTIVRVLTDRKSV